MISIYSELRYLSILLRHVQKCQTWIRGHKEGSEIK